MYTQSEVETNFYMQEQLHDEVAAMGRHIYGKLSA